MYSLCKYLKVGRKVKIETSGDFVVRLLPEAQLYSLLAVWPWARQAVWFSLSEYVKTVVGLTLSCAASCPMSVNHYLSTS